MALTDRQQQMTAIEALRNGRTLVCFFTFDRLSVPSIQGLSTQFNASVKEPLFRVLKESVPEGGKVDLCMYTRGGDTNSVWPLVSLLREFDPEFEVIVPFRCHSAGTLTALGAKRIVMGPLSELSPIDPSTGNQFNPQDAASGGRMPISVEDVQAYRRFILDQLDINASDTSATSGIRPFLDRLVEKVHPLALGNVHRVHQQIKQLAKKLLQLHNGVAGNVDDVIDALASRFYSHLHMINRHEAKEILGAGLVEFASPQLATALDGLLRQYEEDFSLTRPFFLSSILGNDQAKAFRFIGGSVESKSWSYLYETKGEARQYTKLPPGVQLQMAPGQAVPIIPGLPRETEVEVTSQCWSHNTTPRGVTL